MKIAIVEDDINMRKSLELFFSDQEDLEVVAFKGPKEALKALDESFELIITDINMPQMDGLEFLRHLEGRYEAIVITGNATLNKAIESIRLGVKDFFQKPFKPELLLESIYRSKRVLEFHKNKPKQKPSKEFFIASSQALEAVQKQALKAAVTDASVFLQGPSGVGKEVFARFIHTHSKRAKEPFMAINMAAIPEHLLESELFGYEKGAFTDATATKPGLFEMAHKGSVFLDEISEMPLKLQSKLLRVIQEKELMRLGSNKTIKVDLRFIAATNTNIQEKIAAKEFREDLFFRLQTIPLNIPPLKERKEEILPLAEWKLKEVLQVYNLGQKHFSKSAQECLLNYTWHGNIRELLSVVERAAILSEGESISEKDLFLERS
ncbi:sigma-54-dependent transcriptional regulator [Helicobacter suis]|uniref:Transcriptional activator of flagella proteins FlgR n=1 Tax=Helicobacter suis TaxID=104628 RepID=A0A6J4CX34_9HELI|nr:sigma-54 dependent transcriptional regulator [Helicobacter suis]EFX42570.1 Response regulator [Helicobacter suis HS1]BCD45875.1 Transcriptional activator of flagella proteins FlgR [Helicobacter suis]BCD48199.1 Transcriptional activator of flagella proteins FlgR [Helicobacter suis]BCD49958.1 Transcriptional activator of flagella proteins FlgR [Helicobacter suis]BCD51721.1 Transcriptional activator of flagella proteins FlgR [Helicobacter suis]